MGIACGCALPILEGSSSNSKQVDYSCTFYPVFSARIVQISIYIIKPHICIIFDHKVKVI